MNAKEMMACPILSQYQIEGEQFGEGKAKSCIKEITSTIKQLELFPREGPRLEELIRYPTNIWN